MKWRELYEMVRAKKAAPKAAPAPAAPKPAPLRTAESSPGCAHPPELQVMIGGGLRCNQCGEVLVGGYSYVLPGFGRNGEIVLREFGANGKPFAEREAGSNPHGIAPNDKRELLRRWSRRK